MTAIISTMMIALGFINGLIIANLLWSEKIKKMNRLLDEAIDLQLESDQKIDELKDELKKEQAEHDVFVSQLQRLITPHVRLPAPQGPLERCCECTDSEDEEFVCPTSPELDQPNME